ncbi:hypothetical protein ACIBF1_24320 [Spirillospora sp. NPDC050679]
MRLSVKSAALTLGLTGALFATTMPAAQAAIPYRNWVRESGNITGAVFYPYGDRFQIWNNASQGGQTPEIAFVEWNYVGVNDRWHALGSVDPRSSASYSKNLSERRQIYFRVCHYEALKHCSGIVRFRVSGRNP